MNRWEYRVITSMGGFSEDAVEMLKIVGLHSWELVAVVSDGAGMHHYVKRPTGAIPTPDKKD